MDLAKEVLNELTAVDLNGASITKIECTTNETRIAFLIADIEVFFTARNATEYAITSMSYQGQVFDDPNILKEYDAWVGYVAAIVQPIVEAKRLELAEVAYKANVETLQPNEDTIVSTGANISAERLEEAEERGKKEGFKAARKKNIKEIKDLKKKYNIIIIAIVVGLLLTFAAIWTFAGPSSGGSGVPNPPIQQQQEENDEEMSEPDNELLDVDSANDSAEGEEDTRAVAELATVLIELGEAFVFDDLQITLGTEIEWDEVENRFSEHDAAAVFRLPITIINRSPEPHGLNMFSYTQFGPNGIRLDSVSSFFDNDIDWSEQVDSDEIQEAYMHFLFDGDGEYTIEFENASERININFNVQKED